MLKERADNLLYNMLTYEVTLAELLIKIFNTMEIDFSSPDLKFSYSTSSESLLLSFLLLKSYVLLKLRCGSSSKQPQVLTLSFWMTLWPALRRLLDMIEPSSLFMVRVYRERSM